MTKTIEELRVDVEKAEYALREAGKAYREALKEAAPFKVGDVVTVEVQGKWTPKGYEKKRVEAIITRVGTQYNRLSYTGALRNKGGEWSKREQSLDYKDVQKLDA